MAGATENKGLPDALQPLLRNERITVRRAGAPNPKGKCVVYWMQRAQRGVDNHAVNIAVTVANELGLPLVVYFAGISNFPHANLRHYVFLNQGLPDIEEDLAKRNISFVMRRAPHESHEQLLADVQAAFLIGDENPMREPEKWRQQLAAKITIPFWTVDTDVIVPSKLIEKAQYGAYTIRPRLYRLLPEYLVPYENPSANHAWKRPSGFKSDSVNEDMTRGWTNFDRSVKPVEAWKGGTHAGLKRLKLFTSKMLPEYEVQRNHPETDGTSNMSPYLHYGHVGPQTIALAVEAAAKANPTLKSARDSYFNELIAWRELAINFVKYTPGYDTANHAADWANTTIAQHAKDEREHLYTLEQLEQAQTYDDLWNAAQIQMVRQGWMHNYLRMYWGKKILEWTPDAATAVRFAVHLNDKYFLDGRDPNGYAGIAWAILGKFDRAWSERPIFGKIRYMSGASTGRKFNSRQYIKQMNALPADEPTPDLQLS
jgi:deoxyribodipyrimidine photo-lyase